MDRRWRRYGLAGDYPGIVEPERDDRIPLMSLSSRSSMLCTRLCLAIHLLETFLAANACDVQGDGPINTGNHPRQAKPGCSMA